MITMLCSSGGHACCDVVCQPSLGGGPSAAVTFGGIPASTFLFIIVRKTRSNTVGAGRSVVCGDLQLLGKFVLQIQSSKML